MFSFLKQDKGKTINVNDLDNFIGKEEIIDIRDINEYKNGSLRTAKNIPMGNLLSGPEKYLNKDKTYYILCHSGARSARTTKVLEKKGFNVINVAGGIRSYRGTNRKWIWKSGGLWPPDF